MIVVFGASGRIGGLVAERLAAAGEALRCVTRDPERARRSLPPQVEIVAADADTPATLARAIAPGDRVFVATPAGERLEAQQLAIAAAAARAGAARIVKLSGSAWTMPAEAASDTGRAHRAVEAYLETLAMPTASVRPNVFTQTFLARAKLDATTSGVFGLPIGAARFACIDTRDIADVIVHALQAPAAARIGLALHTITGPAAVGGADVAAVLGEHFRHRVEYRPLSIAAALAGARGVSAYQLRHLEAMYRLIAAGAAADVSDTTAMTLERPPRDVRGFLAGRA